MIRLICITVLLLIQLTAWSQATPVLEIGFNDCNGVDDIGNLDNQITPASVECICGVDLFGVEFNEEADSIFLDPGIKDLINEDFSLSLYFWADSSPESFSIFSIQRECSLDSSLVISYLPQTKILEVQIAKNIGQGSFMIAPINEDRCWHHMVLIKEGSNYSLSVDGIFIETNTVPEPVIMGINHQVRLGSSPCLNIFETFMRGRIDDLKIFDYPLSLEEINELDLYPDQIITRDTTIFSGTSVFIETGEICSPNFNWSPNTFLDDPSTIQPTTTPTESVTYFLDINHGTCTSRDSLNVFVIMEDDVDCNNLLMPNVFTPNGDNVNDEFNISNDFIIDQLDFFDIYDRWGTKVFTTGQKDKGWDGLFGGIMQAPSMYVYKIEYTCRNEVFQKLGSFSLLK